MNEAESNLRPSSSPQGKKRPATVRVISGKENLLKIAQKLVESAKKSSLPPTNCMKLQQKMPNTAKASVKVIAAQKSENSSSSIQSSKPSSADKKISPFESLCFRVNILFNSCFEQESQKVIDDLLRLVPSWSEDEKQKTREEVKKVFLKCRELVSTLVKSGEAKKKSVFKQPTQEA